MQLQFKFAIQLNNDLTFCLTYFNLDDASKFLKSKKRNFQLYIYDTFEALKKYFHINISRYHIKQFSYIIGSVTCYSQYSLWCQCTVKNVVSI